MKLDLTRVSQERNVSPVVLVIAHRGAPRLARENTVDSFRAAVASGAGGIELDVRRTAEGALVVHHDPTVGDGRRIVECRRDELPDYVPSLTDALDACRGVIVDIEIKNLPGEPDFDADERVAVGVIAELGDRTEAPAAWLISSFRRETIDRCRAIAPHLATGWLTIGAVTVADIDWVVRSGHTAIHPWDPTVDSALIERCHEAGVHVNTWTCNDIERARQLTSWGIDGICTDVPDVLVDALGG